ncbi:MAG: SurA N-terminal domain-containing protein [Thiolinea sp.]
MNKPDKYLLGLVLSGTLLFASTFGVATAQTLDQIALVVNGDPIMRSEIVNRMKFLQASGNPSASVSAAQLQEAAIDELVMEQLQIQYAQKAGISVDDATLDETMQTIANRNKMNLQTFQAALYRQGISYVQFREQTRNKMLIERLRNQQARQQINISKTEVNDLVSTRTDQLTAGARYRLAHALIPVAEQASVAEINAARQQAFNLRRQTLAAGDSADLSAWKGALSGWKAAEELPAPAIRALALLENGEISEVVRTPTGFHLFKLLESSIPPAQAASNENSLRNQASQFLGERKTDEYYRAWLQSLRNSAHIDFRMKAPE